LQRFSRFAIFSGARFCTGGGSGHKTGSREKQPKPAMIQKETGKIFHG
jgi:hypothetical protein